MWKVKLGAMFAVLMICFSMAPSMLVRAEALEILNMVQTEVRIEAREEPSDNAKVGKIYEPGDYLLIVEGGNDSWHAVGYQGEIYYVKKSDAVKTKAPVAEVEDSEDGAVKEIMIDEAFEEQLTEELEVIQFEEKAFVEEYERYLEETRQKKIWGAIIIVLILAIIGVSVYSYFSGKKEEKGKKAKK